MAHVIKRSKISNDLCSSDQSSSSLSSDLCSLLPGFNDNESQECMQNIFSGEQVFRIDWIREEILNYAIHDNNQNISGELFGTVRLVQKSWLSTATKLLKKCKDPLLIELTLSNESDDINEERKLLDQFNEVFGAVTRLEDSFTPFKLTLGSEFFRRENYQSLRYFFTRLGDELAELEIIYPFDGGSMPVNFPSFYFPILRKLSFHFSSAVNDSIDEHSFNFGDNEFGICLLQSIINASVDLQELDIPYTATGEEDVVPATFEFLQLPPTILSLQLELKLESKTLEYFLVGNHLPNLNHFELQLHYQPFEKGLICKILELFRKTLVNFHVTGQCCTGDGYARTYLQLPQMEKLEFISICSTECELDDESKKLSCLQKFVPKLHRLHLVYQTEAMLRKWIDKSTFEGVNELHVSIVNEFVSEANTTHYRSPSLDTMTQLSASFPNVRTFLITLNFDFLESLTNLFANMTNLKELTIEFYGSVQENSSDLLDSMLTGLSVRFVKALQEDNADILESVLMAKNGSQSSIRNLSELKTLTLWTNDKNEIGEQGQASLISDLLFSQAFLKMPKLRNLYLHGKFQPSDKMRELWTEQGRFIK